jgi:hypothetical protein
VEFTQGEKDAMMVACRQMGDVIVANVKGAVMEELVDMNLVAQASAQHVNLQSAMMKLAMNGAIA